MSKKILQISGSMNRGGAETMIMNVYRRLDTEELQFDFVVSKNGKNDYEDEIRARGGRIYHVCPISKNIVQHMLDIYKIIKATEYVAVHRHACNAVMAIDLFVAKLAGVKIRIAHSHNETDPSIKPYIHSMLRMLLRVVATDKIACSENAARWMYGDDKDVLLFRNSILMDNFRFDSSFRENIRKERNAGDKFIIGHIGRFQPEKNHKFLIEVFKDVVHQYGNTELWLIGDGDLRNEIYELVIRNNLQDKVKFWGKIDNVNQLLSAMDLFLFPSIFEGFPMVLIEAQASGIPCVISDAITKEAHLSNNIKYLSINEEKSTTKWTNEILTIIEEGKRETPSQSLLQYDIQYNLPILMKIYERNITSL